MVDIAALKTQYQELLDKLSDPELVSDPEEMQKLSAEKHFWEEVLPNIQELEKVQTQLQEAQDLAAENDSGSEMAQLARQEVEQLSARKETLEQTIQQQVERHEEEQKKTEERQYPAIIMEIRAGTGGDEASLFAADLYRMYSRYAEEQGWDVRILDARENEIGGYKEITFEVKGRDAWPSFQYEGGVHRVQRIPETEKGGRIHTSTATVAVLPKPKKKAVKINPQDIRIDTYRASGPGGQYVNRRESAVRITHEPTGIVVTSQSERSQQANRANAMGILEARLLEEQRRREAEERGEQRRSQIGEAERSEKIRTYNFPQNRVTDHRIGETWKSLETIIEGDLSPVIEALRDR